MQHSLPFDADLLHAANNPKSTNPKGKTMREINQFEMEAVSGGTLCLLLSLFSWCKPKASCAPKPKTCTPKPPCGEPAPTPVPS